MELKNDVIYVPPSAFGDGSAVQDSVLRATRTFFELVALLFLESAEKSVLPRFALI